LVNKDIFLCKDKYNVKIFLNPIQAKIYEPRKAVGFIEMNEVSSKPFQLYKSSSN